MEILAMDPRKLPQAINDLKQEQQVNNVPLDAVSAEHQAKCEKEAEHVRHVRRPTGKRNNDFAEMLRAEILDG